MNFLIQTLTKLAGKKKKTLGGGVLRAAKRQIAYRIAQETRLAGLLGESVELTRQQRRAAERRSFRQPLGMKQSDWHRVMGYRAV